MNVKKRDMHVPLKRGPTHEFMVNDCDIGEAISCVWEITFHITAQERDRK